MSFLCNTFFSTDQMPGMFRRIVGALPLSQASRMIRAIAHGEDPGRTGYLILLLLLSAIPVRVCEEEGYDRVAGTASMGKVNESLALYGITPVSGKTKAIS